MIEFNPDGPKPAPRSPSQLVTFGNKYRGQPLEVLANDPGYTEWLMQQSWFRDRYPQVVQFIVNNFGEPGDTPEHNEMQARFLDVQWRTKFVACLFPDRVDEWSNPEYTYQKFFGWLNRIFEAKLGPSATMGSIHKPIHCPVLEVCEPIFEFGKSSVDVAFNFETIEIEFTEPQKRDCRDVSFLFYKRLQPMDLLIEIKPTVGDSYPAFLRQINRSQCQYLLFRNFSAVGATEDQFRKIFAASNIRVVSEAEVEATPLPTIAELDQKHLLEIAQYFNSSRTKPTQPTSQPVGGNGVMANIIKRF